MKATITKVEIKGYTIKKIRGYYAVIRNLDKSISTYEFTYEAAEKFIDEMTKLGF